MLALFTLKSGKGFYVRKENFVHGKSQRGLIIGEI